VSARESVGVCEWCGLLSHHLVAGECPPCARKAATMSAHPPRDECVRTDEPPAANGFVGLREYLARGRR